MRIIVNAISANTGGIVTYTSNLIEYVSSSDIETIVYVPEWFDRSQFGDLDVEVISVKTKFFGPVHRFLWEQFVWRRIIKNSGADVVFSSANYGVLFPPAPQVLLVQGEIYLNPVYRERVLSNLSWRERVSAFFRRNLMLASARHSRAVIFPSQVALDSALDYDSRLAENASVNHLGVNPRFKKTDATRRWCEDDTIKLLYVSVYYPHKDPCTLADATLLLNESGTSVATRITMEAHDFEAWDTAKRELEHLSDPKFSAYLKMGRIDHEELSNALADYDAFVFPSMAETFGFPMVEAMQAGIPLIVSDIPVHREICGDAALYFNLADSDDLAARVLELHGDAALRTRIVNAGKRRAEDMYTWSNHVEGLLSVCRQTIDRDKFLILINALHARSGGGVTYLRNMLPLLAQDDQLDVHVCLHEDQRDILPSTLPDVHYHFRKYTRGFWRVLMREQVDIPLLARRLGANATFSPANYGPFLTRNHVVLVRNAISVGFVERRPIKLAYWMLLYLATLTSLLTSKRAIAVSEYAKRGIEGAYWKLSTTPLIVVPHGVDEYFLDPHENTSRELFLLAVSDIYVQKNFLGLLRAIIELRRQFPEIRLKIAGRPVDIEYFEVLKRLIAEADLSSNIEFLGHVETDELRKLYRTCGVFVFPSTVETFGNPLVEAMACGAPIASSNSAAMPEVLGDAAEFFDPNDVDDMCATISGLISDHDQRERLSAAARDRAARYSWQETKRQTLEVIMGKTG